MKTIGTVCLKVVDVIGKICEYICAALAMIITLLVFIQVILRALNMPLFGIEELLTFPTIWIYFLGGACASFTDSHIECGLVGAVAKNPKAIARGKERGEYLCYRSFHLCAEVGQRVHSVQLEGQQDQCCAEDPHAHRRVCHPGRSGPDGPVHSNPAPSRIWWR